MLHTALRQMAGNLTPTEQKLAEYALSHLREIPFISATEIAAAVTTTPSSVTRFAKRLGYQGYPDLQRQVRGELRRAQALHERIPGKSYVSDHWQIEARNLAEVSNTPLATIHTAVSALTVARRVWVIGARATLPAAQFVAAMLRTLRPDVTLIDSAAQPYPEWVLDAGPEDVVLAYSIKRYAVSTTKLVDAFQRRRTRLIAVTDGPLAPIIQHANVTLTAPVGTVGPFASISTLVSLSILLVAGVAEALGGERIAAAEQLWEEFGIFEL